MTPPSGMTGLTVCMPRIGPTQVDVQHGSDLLSRPIGQWCPPVDACVVDQDVDPAVLGDDVGHHRGPVPRLGDVEVLIADGVTETHLERGAFGVEHVTGDHASTQFRHQLHFGSALTARGAGDEDDLVVEAIGVHLDVNTVPA